MLVFVIPTDLYLRGIGIFVLGSFLSSSWSPRVLETLSQRVEVLRVFALSRVYYLASILPINVTMVRKFEKEMAKFQGRF